MKTNLLKSSAKSQSESTQRDGRTRRPMHRIYEIHASIRNGSLPNCSTLAEVLEVDRKTIQRDISFMRDALGLPLVYCDDLHGYRYDGDVSDFPVFDISAEELATLFFTRTALQDIRGTRLADALGSAFAKITRSLLGKIEFTWSDLDEAFSHKSVQQDQSQIKCFGQLAKAILDQTETVFHYRKLEGESAEPRKVQPLHLGEVEGGWYLIAHDLDRGALRTFALPRMSRCRILQTRFERPADFNGTAYLNKSFGVWNVAGDDTRHVVRLELQNYAARLAQERRWHPTQELTVLNDRGTKVEVRFEVGRLEEEAVHVLEVEFGESHPIERGEAFLNQAFPGRLRVLIEGKADVVAGDVENAKAHEEEEVMERGMEQELVLLKNLMEI